MRSEDAGSAVWWAMGEDINPQQALWQIPPTTITSLKHHHGLRAGGYSQPHRDPFDRMLAAQAELDRLVLLTADPQLSTFPCQTLW
ncbi:hypothetical protein ACLM45_00935 [Synechococcus sp. A10-1-5-9]|uniref:hypothetical protein n=1 Tax=Synechococcus sp. A10-1-5-9 TaxID=3392295 RepID=UPI0039E9D92B